ncbi:UDP-glucose 4-epimerase [Erysipelothrix larvae]|uniref:UDP-glucose 4-epimerase n=1 Tax=Erysipelothrix larvae TaxID=1514105 RepID=A0A0X8GYU8_9FIRM|nr:UDP-glucose 4-epimerase GalE [Erysipelothrix larvae]AMC92920.1 UDP-glucose 4-epimerase [Erysipelothrix larvae]
MKVLVTGGAGFIGSHTVVLMMQQGYEAVIVDNLYNASEVVLDRIEAITGKKPRFIKCDILDKEALRGVFEQESFDAVIHFAGLKAVGESSVKPIEYYQNNIAGTLNVCELMRDYGVKKIIFSSSATVYGKPESVPIPETAKTSTTNPYGTTKLYNEVILQDIQKANPDWSVIILRYFNPIGAHKSGTMGEDPKGIPNNLVPYITQVAIGRREFLSVYGDDYDTHDGTGVRDYIHVLDLAQGHIDALKYTTDHEGYFTFNLGTGIGYSVLDVVKAFEKATGKTIPYKVQPRRPGDIDECYADATRAKEALGWVAQYDIDTMCQDSWNWQKNNPFGYEQSE